MKKVKALLVIPVAVISLGGQLAGCKSNGGSGSEDTSASGAVAAAVGGALAGSSSSGTISKASRQNARGAQCPTIETNDSGCIVVTTSNVIALTYNACSFGSSSATWSGQHQVTAAGISCGNFPMATISRQFVTGAQLNTPGQPYMGTRTSTLGTKVTIDHQTINLGNFNDAVITPLIGVGFGTIVTWSGNVRTSLEIAEHVTATAFDYSIYTGTPGTGSSSSTATPLSISEDAGATYRTIDGGSATVYHNLLGVIGTSVFNNVGFVDSCCMPTSGSIKTSFASTPATTSAAGTALNGKSETLTFTGCGSGSLLQSNGITINVNLDNCYL